mgnify:CR=1 FL=1
MMYTVPARPWTRCALDRGSMQGQIWRRLLARPVWLLAAGVAVLLLLGFGLLFYSSLRHDVQLRPLQAHLRYLSALEDLDTRLRASEAVGSENAETPRAGELTEEIERLIIERRSTEDIQKTAIMQGMISMRHDGLRKVAGGMTSLEEILRVVA